MTWKHTYIHRGKTEEEEGHTLAAAVGGGVWSVVQIREGEGGELQASSVSVSPACTCIIICSV